jgi:hypothetical protein
MLSIIYAECHEKLFKLSVIILTVVMLSVVVPRLITPHNRSNLIMPARIWQEGKWLEETNTLAYNTVVLITTKCLL